jgi:hypothetical protein
MFWLTVLFKEFVNIRQHYFSLKDLFIFLILGGESKQDYRGGILLDFSREIVAVLNKKKSKDGKPKFNLEIVHI